MKNEINIKRLAELSRINVSDQEESALRADIDSILSYVEHITNVSSDLSSEIGDLYNVMREDGEPHKTGLYTKDLLKESSLVNGDYIEVKKIINQDK